MYGNDGDDILKGSNGNDEIWGGYGNDIIKGQDDNNILHGGDGRDAFVYDDSDINDGHDTILDFKLGEDLLDLTSFWKVGNAVLWDSFNTLFDNSNHISITDSGEDALIQAITSYNGFLAFHGN